MGTSLSERFFNVYTSFKGDEWILQHDFGNVSQELSLFRWLGGSLGRALFNGGTDRAVNGSWFAFFGILDLFVFGVHKRFLAVLVDKEFVGHGDILHE